MVDAVPCLTTEKTVAMFERFNVFSRTELEARAAIKYETYAKDINIEARTMIDIAGKQIIPAVIRYTKTLGDTISSVTSAGVEADVQTELLREASALLAETKRALNELIRADAAAAEKEEGEEQARAFHDEVMPAMQALRAPVDKLEMIVDKEIWPMPSYGDLLFEV